MDARTSAIFLFFTWNSLLGKFGQKNQNCQFKLKFGSSANSTMQNAMALFIFSVLDRKHPFWANLVQKIRIVTLSWNLLSRLIRTCNSNIQIQFVSDPLHKYTNIGKVEIFHV